MSNKKQIIAAALNFAVVIVTIAYIAFIFLDINVLHVTLPETGGDGSNNNAGLAIGAAVVLALMIYFSFLPYAIVSLFSVINGAVGLSKAKKGERLPKGLLIVGVIFKIIALVSNAFFLIVLFDGGLIAWGIDLLVATLVTLLSLIFDFMAAKKLPASVAEAREETESVKECSIDK